MVRRWKCGREGGLGWGKCKEKYGFIGGLNYVSWRGFSGAKGGCAKRLRRD